MLLQAQLENSTAMADMAKDGPDHNGNAAKTAAAASTAASMASMAQAIYAMPGAPGGGAGGYAPFQSLMGALSNLPPAMATAKGHMTRTRQGLCSTQSKTQDIQDARV